jgi:hypothetical protein
MVETCDGFISDCDSNNTPLRRRSPCLPSESKESDVHKGSSVEEHERGSSVEEAVMDLVLGVEVEVAFSDSDDGDSMVKIEAVTCASKSAIVQRIPRNECPKHNTHPSHRSRTPGVLSYTPPCKPTSSNPSKLSLASSSNPLINSSPLASLTLLSLSLLPLDPK